MVRQLAEAGGCAESSFGRESSSGRAAAYRGEARQAAVAMRALRRWNQLYILVRRIYYSSGMEKQGAWGAPDVCMAMGAGPPAFVDHRPVHPA